MEEKADLFLLRIVLHPRSGRLHVSGLKNANRCLLGLLSGSFSSLPVFLVIAQIRDTESCTRAIHGKSEDRRMRNRLEATAIREV